MNQKGSTGLLVSIFVVLILAAGAMFFMRKNTGNEPQPVPPSMIGGVGETITVVGKVGCLPHKDQEGPQTQECAFGVRNTSGIYYGLLDTTPDYSFVGNLVTGDTISVSGTLREPSSNNMYVNIGVIEIESVEPVTIDNKL